LRHTVKIFPLDNYPLSVPRATKTIIWASYRTELVSLCFLLVYVKFTWRLKVRVVSDVDGTLCIYLMVFSQIVSSYAKMCVYFYFNCYWLYEPHRWCSPRVR